MKSLEIIVEKLKEKGIANAEELCLDVFTCIQEAVAEVAIHPETTSVEKGIAGTALLVLPALKPQFEKLVDFNRDGQIG